jgi:hypothetical protein
MEALRVSETSVYLNETKWPYTPYSYHLCLLSDCLSAKERHRSIELLNLLPDWQSDPVTDLVTDLQIGWLTDCDFFIDWLTLCSIVCLIYWPTDWLTEWLIALTTEAARTSETSVNIHLTTRQFILQDSKLHDCDKFTDLLFVWLTSRMTQYSLGLQQQHNLRLHLELHESHSALPSAHLYLSSKE